MIIDRITCQPVSTDCWPYSIPPVARLVQDGLTLDTPITFLVGENGSGKSTIVEAIAEAYGLDARGGRAGRKYVNDRPKTLLGETIKLHGRIVGNKRDRKGYFLRAETAHGFMSFVSGMYGYWEENVMEMSHGEGFLTVLNTMFRDPGLYIMDEPEAALSFTSCLKLVEIMKQVAHTGGQIICATHSPILTALPGATVWELGKHGIRKSSWRELELVDNWRRFLENPNFYMGD
ncbi:putative ATPase [Croceifilum oryzae]|uniref:ATPase n=1 Tax=Croceifilum oryzae TaxID=1553429 RepID=A0AAJ1TJT1_9BACL|nr:AAA family ATPase [Croceifilum oryzae]MDQ0417812.1 putative ATPase [Croceifilum oryzae]